MNQVASTLRSAESSRHKKVPETMCRCLPSTESTPQLVSPNVDSSFCRIPENWTKLDSRRREEPATNHNPVHAVLPVLCLRLVNFLDYVRLKYPSAALCQPQQSLSYLNRTSHLLPSLPPRYPSTHPPPAVTSSTPPVDTPLRIYFVSFFSLPHLYQGNTHTHIRNGPRH